MIKRILITGGAGFIGSSLVKTLLDDNNNLIFNLDKITSVSCLKRIQSFNPKRHFHFKVDLFNHKETIEVLNEISPDLVIHLAAESHVDNSLYNPRSFIESNIIGTFNILEASRKYWEKLPLSRKESFRFHHVSTDEVFGSLGPKGQFNEDSKYDPKSPYSASKASSDHLVNSWHNSYSLPTIISNCSNNYGPYQYPEKLIPLAILNAIQGKDIPLYGDGMNVRDWLYVEDHVDALILIANKGKIGETYCIGGLCEKRNKDLIMDICNLLDQFLPKGYKHENLIKFVEDRPGHDKRYSINPTKIISELGWQPKHSFEKGIEKTVLWYLENRNFWK